MSEGQHRSYSYEERMQAVGLALSVGAHKASEMLGIPRENISRWLRRADSEPAILASRRMIADRLWEAVEVGVEQVLAGLQDPEARLSDKARALEVVSTQYALMTGGVTSRSATVAEDPTDAAALAAYNLMTPQERAEHARWLEAVAAGLPEQTSAFAEALGLIGEAGS